MSVNLFNVLLSLFRGGTTVYVRGSTFNHVNKALLIVNMVYQRLDDSRSIVTQETNFTSDVRN